MILSDAKIIVAPLSAGLSGEKTQVIQMTHYCCSESHIVSHRAKCRKSQRCKGLMRFWNFFPGQSCSEWDGMVVDITLICISVNQNILKIRRFFALWLQQSDGFREGLDQEASS
jgi:hypothetical protein